jgi:hypothetical protein
MRGEVGGAGKPRPPTADAARGEWTGGCVRGRRLPDSEDKRGTTGVSVTVGLGVAVQVTGSMLRQRSRAITKSSSQDVLHCVRTCGPSGTSQSVIVALSARMNVLPPAAGSRPCRLRTSTLHGRCHTGRASEMPACVAISFGSRQLPARTHSAERASWADRCPCAVRSSRKGARRTALGIRRAPSERNHGCDGWQSRRRPTLRQLARPAT